MQNFRVGSMSLHTTRKSTEKNLSHQLIGYVEYYSNRIHTQRV